MENTLAAEYGRKYTELKDKLEKAIGGRIVTRHKLLGGLAIVYANTSEYAVEIRLANDGRHLVLLNGKAVGSIPSSYRKANGVLALALAFSKEIRDLVELSSLLESAR